MTEETKEVQVKNVNADLEKAKLDLKMEMIKLRAGYAKAFNLFEQQVKAPSLILLIKTGDFVIT